MEYARIESLETQKKQEEEKEGTGKAQALEVEYFEGQEASTYGQKKEEVKTIFEEMRNEIQSPKIVRQSIEEMNGGSTSGLDNKDKKIKKMKRKIKEIEVLERYLKTENQMSRTQSHKIHEDNEKLKKKNRKLERETIVLTN
jgi:hypothetical protein